MFMVSENRILSRILKASSQDQLDFSLTYLQSFKTILPTAISYAGILLTS